MTNYPDEARKLRQEALVVGRLLAARKKEALRLRSQVEEITSIYTEL